jgi:hypothetical protein
MKRNSSHKINGSGCFVVNLQYLTGLSVVLPCYCNYYLIVTRTYICAGSAVDEK